MIRLLLGLSAVSGALLAADFADDFERPDSPPQDLGEGWTFLGVGGWIGDNAAIRNGRLVPNYSEPSKVYYACIRPPRLINETGATIVWEAESGFEPSTATFIIAAQTNSAHYWGLHAGTTRYGWRIGYLPEPPFRDIVVAQGIYAVPLEIGRPYEVSFRIDPEGCTAILPQGTVRAANTNFWHFANTTGTNWVVWEMYSGNAANMQDRMEFESVYATQTFPEVQILIADGFANVDLDPEIPGFIVEGAYDLTGPWIPTSGEEQLIGRRFYRAAPSIRWP